MEKRRLNIKSLRRVLIALVAILIVAVLIAYFGFRYWQAEKTPQGETDLSFSPVEIPFTQKADLVNSLPFMAGAAIDINGDGVDEVFFGGGNKQADKMFEFSDGKFKPLPLVFEKDAVDATMGAASLDIDNDGDTDLFTARESGVWFHENTDGKFKSERLPLKLADNTTPLSIAFGDINKDGLADMFVSGYIKSSLVQGQSHFAKGYGGYSSLFLNNGNGEWQDISKSAGTWRQHNTFTSVFVDLDNDSDSDIAIAEDTGHVVTYKNNGDMTFTRTENPSVYSYPMGVGVGDYDNDGLVDLYFSNVGYTLPPAMLRGDLTKEDKFNPAYMLFHNDGNMRFSDTANSMNAARYGFGWGTVIADMNLDGKQDMLAAQNYARFPVNDLLEHYPGLILQNYGDTFRPVTKVSGGIDRPIGEKEYGFGISPIVSDFNQDGKPDLVWVNLDGKAVAYLNNMPDKNWLKIRLPNIASSLGARITVTDKNGNKQTKQFLTSEGLCSDQGRDIIFGFSDNGVADKIVVEFQNGDIQTINQPDNNSVISISTKTQ